MGSPHELKNVKQDYWKFTQWFRKMQGVQPGLDQGEGHDFLTAVEFDSTGRFLATGDRSGNIVVLESDPSSKKAQVHYSFFCEFVSHFPDFDFVKSMPVEEKINKMQFGPSASDGMYLLTTNDKQIKLWKVSDKEQFKVQGWNIDPTSVQHYGYTPKSALNTARGRPVIKTLKVPKMIKKERAKVPSLRKMYASDVHSFNITALSMTADQTSFLSGDNLRINLWDMNVGTHAYNVLDVKPDNMDDLSEIISSANCHPQESNMFLYSTSLGNIMTCDLRMRALVDEPTQVFSEKSAQPGTAANGDEGEQEQQSFFNEMTQNVTAAKYSHSGKYIFSRDYMTVKIWDTAMETAPIQTIYVHEYLREKMWDLYSNDLLWDPFSLGVSSKGDVVTGSYSNYFHIFDNGKSTDTFIQASNQPTKVADLAQSKKKKETGVAADGGESVAGGKKKKKGGGLFFKKKKGENVGSAGRVEDEYPFNIPFENIEFSKKIIDCAWHPEKDAVAIAGQNNLYIYTKLQR